MPPICIASDHKHVAGLLHSFLTEPTALIFPLLTNLVLRIPQAHLLKMENNEPTCGDSDHSSTPKATGNIRLEDAENEDIGKAIARLAVASDPPEMEMEHSDRTESEDSDYIGSNEEVYGSYDEEDSETESEDDGNDGEGSSHPDPEVTVEFFNDDAFPELSTLSTPIGAPHLLVCSNKWKWAKLSLFDFEMLSVPDAIVTVLYNVDKAALRVFLDHEHYEIFEFRRVELSQDCTSMSMVIQRVRKRVLVSSDILSEKTEAHSSFSITVRILPGWRQFDSAGDDRMATPHRLHPPRYAWPSMVP